MTTTWSCRVEEVYHVLPAPQVPLKVPNVWPFAPLQQRLDR